MATIGIDLDEQVLAMLADPLNINWDALTDTQQRVAVETLTTLRRLTEVAQATGLNNMVTRSASTRGVEKVADWLHHHSELLLRDSRATVRHAVRLCAEESVLTDFADGDISHREAKYIVDFLAHPPKDMPAEAHDSVRDCLRHAAGERDMSYLQGAGELLRDLYPAGPTPAQDVDRNELRVTRTLRDRYDIQGNIDQESGEWLLEALAPYSIPRTDIDGNPDPRSAAQRLGEALSELARRNKPETTGSVAPANRPRLNLHIRLEDLFGHIPTHSQRQQMIRDGRFEELFALAPAGRSNWANSYSADAMQRIACDCEMTMIGVDEQGAPLSVNTGKRFASAKHRLALNARDHGCAFPGCDRPPSWTEAHHIIPWGTAHLTAIDNLTSLCHAHHVAVHHHGWTVAMGLDRFPIFRPPPRVDTLQRWRGSDGKYVDEPPPGDPTGGHDHGQCCDHHQRQTA